MRPAGIVASQNSSFVVTGETWSPRTLEFLAPKRLQLRALILAESVRKFVQNTLLMNAWMPTAPKWALVPPPAARASATLSPLPHQLVPKTKPRRAAMLVTFEARTAIAWAQPQFHFLGEAHRHPMRSAQILPSCRHSPRDPFAPSRPRPTDAQPGEPPQD